MAKLSYLYRYQTFEFRDLNYRDPGYKPDIFIVLQVWPEGKVACAQFTNGEENYMTFPMINISDFRTMVKLELMVETNDYYDLIKVVKRYAENT